MAEHTRTYALTGAGGFLGWHVKLALHALGHDCIEVPLGDRFELEQAVCALGQADHLIHLAGVNRGSDDAVAQGNDLFARQIAEALARCAEPPGTISYANSIQQTYGNVYGNSKRAAGETLWRAAERSGTIFRGIELPNLFGEHGKPFYNSVVATFCHLLATGSAEPSVHHDRELCLLHAQDAADWLIGAVEDKCILGLLRRTTVTGILIKLTSISEIYRRGEFPDLSKPFARDLFNTYRSYVPVGALPVRAHSDNRGSFVEMARCWGGNSQSSFSTTLPGITRGNHYHRRKVERFVVLAGKAKVGLRRMFSDQVMDITVDGDLVAIDQPTGWTHQLSNTGDQLLYTYFWTNDIFDPTNPDTYLEPV